MATDDGGVGGGGGGGRGGGRRQAKTPYNVGGRARAKVTLGPNANNRSGRGGGGNQSSLLPTTVEILNLPQGQLAALRAFLNNRLQNQVKWTSLKYEGTSRAVVELATKADAKRLTALNGVFFNSMKLQIRLAKATGSGRSKIGVPPSLSPQHHSLLDAYLAQRYASGVLNLVGMSSDASLASLRINPDDVTMASVLTYAASRCPEAVGVNLDGNGISKLAHIAGVFSREWKQCGAISLNNNNISDYKEFKHLSRAVQVQHLMCDGNPFCATFTSPEAMRAAFALVLPKLSTINNEEIERAVLFAVAGPSGGPSDDDPLSSLPSVQLIYGDSEPNVHAATAFLSAFLPVFDTDRTSAATAYADSAVLSVTVTQNATDSSTGAGANAASSNGSFKEFLKIDRNHRKEKDPEKRAVRAYVGREAIAAVLARMPRTKHDEVGVEMDVFVVGTRLFASFHGTLTETTERGKRTTRVVRAYDRTLVLAPAPPGSPAATMGLPVEITNDQLNIRYVARTKFAPKPKGKKKGGKSKALAEMKRQQHHQQLLQQQQPQQQQQTLVQSPQQQQQALDVASVAGMLSNRTQLPPETCMQALEAANGDFNTALSMIEQYKQQQQQQQQ